MVDFGGSDTKDFEDGNINTGSNLGPNSLLTSADAAILCNSNLIHSNESDKTFRKLILIQSTRIFPFHVKPNQILSIFGKNLETKVRLYGLGQIDRLHPSTKNI
ncbi:MAG TPA: hypothetical protein VHH33_03490 [Nitrososphaeraceae archaeon]|nr:hypothetical protein [Nitrososphaeraceae archaeon]